MRAPLLLGVFFLTACTTSVEIHGRYAAALSPSDIQQIRLLAHHSPHFGHTRILLDAVRRDRVHVRSREYQGTGWSGSGMFVIRRDSRWHVDSPVSAEAERTITVY